jgi:gliding motility-associated-like protein
LYYIPNSFTPDGNEYNQMWLPVFTAGFDPYNYYLAIYNRWGEMVFESNDATQGWDGTYGIYNCQDGLYVYEVHFGTKTTSAKYTLTGHFNLIR